MVDETELARRQDQEIRESFIRCGRMWTKLAVTYRDFKEHSRWKLLGYPSLDAWRKTTGIKHSTFYGALALAEKLQDIPVEKLQEVPQQNAYMLKRLTPAQRRDPVLIEQAQSLPEKRFAEVVQKLAPDVECLQRRGFTLPVSLWDQWDFGMRGCALKGGSESTEAKIELLLRTFLESPADDDDPDGPTVEDRLNGMGEAGQVD